MLKFIKHIAIIVSLVVSYSLQLVAQHGTSPVGVNWVFVSFDQPPDTLTVTEAPLKYNKDFALSMQIDDADTTLFTHGYPVFEGGEVSGTTYPGLFYSNGCGDSLNFKMSSSVYVFEGDSLNGPDIHIDNSYGQLTWEQMDSIYNNNWGILNHGVNSDENTEPSFINYSISRNKSYIRRKLYNSTEGGVMPHVFVNPNGNPHWTIPAFDLGNISALNQNELFPIGNNGGDVNAPGVDWTQPYSLNRRIAENLTVTDFVDGLADSSVAGANYWCPIYTESLTDYYLFNRFVPDFNYIANTYGINGLDNILMTTDEEILDYLIVRDSTTINYVINGTSLLITYSGEVRDDLLYYSSSLVIESDAIINSITIDGTDDYTFTGIGETNALINLNWDGYYVIPPEQLADSMVTIASDSATQTQYNCWIAMDYVITMTNGPHKDSLRQVLCNIPNRTYDEGFCDCEIDIQPPDTTINFGDCIDLFGAEGDYTYEWFIGDSLVDTTQNIYTCPEDTTTRYDHIATNTFGCPAEDSIIVNINFLSFDLGPDTNICEGDCVTITGPDNMADYEWYVADTVYATVQTIEPCPVDTTQYTLRVKDEFNATAEDSITVYVLSVPTINFEYDSVYVCLGNDIELITIYNPDIDSIIWHYNGDSITQTNTFTLIHPDTSDYVYATSIGLNGCTDIDSTYLTVLLYPKIEVSNDTVICSGDSLTLSVSGGSIFLWIVDSDTISTNSTIVVYPEDSTNYIAQTAFADSICYSEDTVTVTVYNAAETEISYNTDTIVCTFDTVVLTASGADLYQWKPGEDTTNIYTFWITDTTTIWLTGTTNDGCQSVDSVTFYNKPTPEVSFTGLLPAYCENDPFVELTGEPPGGIFSGTGIVGNKFYPQSAEPGIHEIIYSYTNLEPCTGYDTSSTTVYGNGDTIDLGPDFTLLTDDSHILDAGSGFNSYFWTTGATTQSITVLGDEKSPGTYEYSVMGVINGCSTRGSVIITFKKPDGYHDQHINGLTIFPNPNDGSFSIKFSSAEKNIRLSIFNLQGKLLYEKDNVSCNEDCKIDVQLHNIGTGFYFLHITTSKGVSTAKIILK